MIIFKNNHDKHKNEYDHSNNDTSNSKKGQTTTNNNKNNKKKTHPRTRERKKPAEAEAEAEAADDDEQEDEADALALVQSGLPAGAEPAVRLGDGTKGHADHQLNNPRGMSSVPAHRHLVIVTCFSSHQVRVYDITSSRLLCKMGKEGGRSGQGEGEFNCPWGVVVTADSAHVIVAETGNARVQVLSLVVSDDGRTAELGFVREIGKGQLKSPYGLALRSAGDSQTVLVAEGGGYQVSEWSLEGTKVRTIGTGKEGSGDGELNFPTDVTVLPVSGQIAIADENNHRVSVFDGESGSFVRAFGSQGRTKDGQFDGPCAIAADAHNHLLVLDANTSRLQVFDADGTHLHTRTDLGLRSSSFKGLAWRGDGGEGRLAITNGGGHDARLFF